MPSQACPSSTATLGSGGATSQVFAAPQRKPKSQATSGEEQTAPSAPGVAQTPQLAPFDMVQVSDAHCDGNEQL